MRMMWIIYDKLFNVIVIDPFSIYITFDLGFKDKVEGDYVQTSPPASNDWHYVSIRGQISSQNIFTWKNKAGVEWDLIFIEEESSGVYKFEVGKLTKLAKS